MLASLNSALAEWLPPLALIILWGLLSAALSMALYKWLSPQKKLQMLKQSQKEVRSVLMKHEGEWDGLQKLIKQDLALSFKQLALVTGPVLLSVAPVLALVYELSILYGDKAYTDFGPEWAHGFIFWYILSLTVGSLVIKIIFKII